MEEEIFVVEGVFAVFVCDKGRGGGLDLRGGD